MQWTKATVQLVQAELAKIKKQRGAVTNEIIVDVARDAMHPLHKFFEWSDAAAAEKYRLMQAGELVRSVRIFVEQKQVYQPRTASVTMSDSPPSSRRLSVVKPDRKQADDKVISEAWAKLQQWASEYKGYEELARVADEVARLAQIVDKLVARGAKKAV